ncbi:unnamed protein product [Pseudo-nitzschia multistriata]|uniref:2-(3-amino-3-carboxypropyl)histidine synthase n=1 Tax=Pseudo-nitzschia multistriata TaxID=183589 RepID=A0A448Z453_9STRA|nr:unnamed protein product [Pseudo-nitzschia multistriata]
MSSTRGPPQLMFDDGSRVMMEDSESNVVVPNESSEQPLVPIQRGSIPLHVYYEINRMSTETIDLLVSEESSNSTESTTVLRIALQFPDELLQDSPEVCWLLEDKIREELEGRSRTNIIPFCFVLGDTTVNSCCPDEVAALHLNADVLIHYGHACLSPTGTLPVLYSFGKLEFGDLDGTVSQLQAARSERSKDDTTNNKFLVLYQVGYHHAMKELQERWMNEDTEKSLQVVVAEIPALSQKCNQRPKTSRPTVNSTRTGGCCQSDNSPKNNTGSSGCCGDSSESPSEKNIVLPSSSCCNSREKGENCLSAVSSEAGTLQEGEPDQSDPGSNEAPLRPMVVGGLELPRDKISSWDDLVDYTVLFIMGNPESDADKYSTDDNTTPQQRHYANSMLCFLSLPHGEPQGGYWIYSPKSKALRTNVSPPPAIRRQLKRRFFLTQKARDANVFGILVSNLSQQYLVDVVKSLQRIIQDADRTAYSFAVGKINPAKLSNFAEIETFVMVACRENSLLDQEREYPIPVITPMELEIALENLQWGMQPYSLDCQDVMIRLGEERQQKQLDAMGGNTDGENANDNCSVENEYDNDDSDAPYFSMITGRYESRKSKTSSNDLDLRALPGQGQVTEYKSEAANFLKQREYQGLESKVGETEAKAAVLGMRGIASGYDK